MKRIINSLRFTQLFLLAAVVIVALIGVNAVFVQAYADTSANQGYYDPKGNPFFDKIGPGSATQSAANGSTNTTNSSATQHSGNPNCSGSYCWYYVTSWQENFTATGASVVMTQANPKLGPNDFHTLMELAVHKSITNPSNDDIIEVGWTVNHRHSDGLPRLFVYHWVDGHNSCYNSCGFVTNPNSPKKPGSVLTTGTTGKFEINYVTVHLSSNKLNKQWQIRYNGELVGYFPAAIWGGTFTRIHGVQVYGEVSIPRHEKRPQSQMGNGKYGTDRDSAIIKKFSLINSTNSEKLIEGNISDPNAYSRGGSSSLGMNLGGPGYSR